MKKLLWLLIVVLCLVGCGQKTGVDKKEMFKGTTGNVSVLKTGEEMNRYFTGDGVNQINATKIIFDRYNENNYGFVWGEGEDVSENEDMSIQLFKKIEKTEKNKWYQYTEEWCTIYILSKDVIEANKDSRMMFDSLGLLENVEFNNFDTSNVREMYDMFGYCKSLTNLDLSNFDTSNVREMDDMFGYCSNLINLDISSFNTSNVRYMSGMFNGCKGLKSLDLSNFDTSKVEDMGFMFWGCSSLTNLDVSNFDTSNVRCMGRMFRNCSNLENLNISNFNMEKVENKEEMFDGCTSLKNIDISKYQ